MIEINSAEAFKMLHQCKDLVIIDTRTEEEWINVGYPDVGDNILLLSSHLKPHMELNSNFIGDLTRIIEQKDRNLLFICRTSTRSTIAATLATQNGYKNCYIISDGFEGSTSGPGWKNLNLPFCYKI